MRSSGRKAITGLLEGINREAGSDTVHLVLHEDKLDVVRNFELLEEVKIRDGDDLVEVVRSVKKNYK